MHTDRSHRLPGLESSNTSLVYIYTYIFICIHIWCHDRSHRLPGLESSNISLDTLMGTDSTIDFPDYLNSKYIYVNKYMYIYMYVYIYILHMYMFDIYIYIYIYGIYKSGHSYGHRLYD
jgi:hypothetical protein